MAIFLAAFLTAFDNGGRDCRHLFDDRRRHLLDGVVDLLRHGSDDAHGSFGGVADGGADPADPAQSGGVCFSDGGVVAVEVRVPLEWDVEDLDGVDAGEALQDRVVVAGAEPDESGRAVAGSADEGAFAGPGGWRRTYVARGWNQ